MNRFFIILFSLSFLIGGFWFYQKSDIGTREIKGLSSNKLALIIGNGTYQNAPSLSNPVNDAEDMAAVLKTLGYKVILKLNASRKAMIIAAQDFGDSLQKQGGVGLFYYSGHGLQTNGINYLVPSDANIKTAADIEFAGVDANRFLAQMEQAKNPVNLVILDACRDNPYGSRIKGMRKGLADMKGPTGSLIAFATAPNKPSWGGKTGERNSIYTKYLLDNLRNKPHLRIEDLFIDVRNQVTAETKDEEVQQVPWESGSLTGKFCFGNCAPDDNEYQKQIAKLQQQIAQLQQIKPEPKPKPRIRLPEMVWIPAGEFQMGDIQGGGDSDEKPVHTVSVESFYMGKYEVTVGEFRDFIKDTKYKTDANTKGSCSIYNKKGWISVKGANWQNPKFFQSDNHPVTCVSWNDATKYAAWLSDKTGKNYRLPTEAEWEYAARAGTETKYWWGNKIGQNNANCHNGYCGDSFHTTAPVGSFKDNPFHIYDTVGNVWEWCSDIYSSDYYKNSPSKPKGPSTGRYRVRRGGAWSLYAQVARAANRIKESPERRLNYLGFRLARQP